MVDSTRIVPREFISASAMGVSVWHCLMAWLPQAACLDLSPELPAVVFLGYQWNRARVSVPRGRPRNAAKPRSVPVAAGSAPVGAGVAERACGGVGLMGVTPPTRKAKREETAMDMGSRPGSCLLPSSLCQCERSGGGRPGLLLSGPAAPGATPPCVEGQRLAPAQTGRFAWCSSQNEWETDCAGLMARFGVPPLGCFGAGAWPSVPPSSTPS